MRDILTALAGAVILILVAALAVPPFVAWEGQRALIDRTIARSLGVPARTEGRIDLRLLPSPRLRLDRLRIGAEAGPALDLRSVTAEVALAPLLKGEARFTETRIGRAEVTLPVGDDDTVTLPANLSETLAGRDLAIEALQVQLLVLTSLSPSGGRTDQARVEDLHLSAPKLLGPWRAEGTSAGVPFRLASGEPADGRVAVKVSGGGDTRPRFEADAHLGLDPVQPDPGRPAPGDGLRAAIPTAEGSGRLVVGPPAQAAGAYLPFSLGGTFKARGPLVRFADVTAEIDPGGQAIRLAGTGRIDLRAGRAALALEARRVDLDAFLLSSAGQALIARGLPHDGDRGAALPVMVDLDLSVETMALGLDEWRDLSLAGTVERTGGVALRRFAATAPGAAALTATGEIDTRPTPRFTGHLALDAPASDGFGRYLRKLGLGGPAVAVMDGRRVQASADLSAAAPSLSLRNLRLTLGEARITGNARYLQGDGAARGRFDAQVAAQGLDVATLPAFGDAFAALNGHDVGLTIQARDVRYGPAGARPGGTIAASIRSDGASLAVDSLEVTDLAGANAALSGRIAPDGAGRIAGHVSAPVAAPLLALLDRVWTAEARLIPAFVRAGALDLDVTLEREAGAADTLRTTARGKAAGGSLALDLLSRAGRIDAVDVTLASPSAGLWFGREDIAGLRQPARLRIAGARAPSAAGGDGTGGGLGLDVSGTIAGLTVATVEPVRLGPGPAPPEAGEVRLGTADLAPFLSLAGSAAAIPGPLPADLTVGLSRAGPDARADLSGRVAGATVSAHLGRAPEGEVAGSVALGRLSLPWLAAALVIPVEAAGRRFAPPPPPRPGIDLDLRVDTLDLGGGYVATGAAFGARLDDGVLSLRDLSATLAGGRLTGSVGLSRQGGAAALSGEGRIADASVAGLAGLGAIDGRVTAALRFGASAESGAGLMNNLGGSGTITLAGVTLPGGDPGGVERALARALDDDDPLREGRLQALLNEEVAAGPFSAPAPATAPATLVGGTLRAGPLSLALGRARWNGLLGLDLRTGRLDARGTLTGGAGPKGWSGAVPAVPFGVSGPVAHPAVAADAGPLASGLAAVVLQRELEKIELFEADQTERLRRRARIEMDKARAAALKAAADRAAADRAAAEEAARQNRLRAQQAADDAARQARLREAEDAARRAAETPAGQP